jgi:hypothetical protein
MLTTGVSEGISQFQKVMRMVSNPTVFKLDEEQKSENENLSTVLLFKQYFNSLNGI